MIERGRLERQVAELESEHRPIFPLDDGLVAVGNNAQ